jgi:hypothetical protein
MKSVKIPMAAAAVLATAVLAAPCAQAGVVLKAQIPFDFLVADQWLPSGEYRIVQDHWLVKLYAEGGAQVAVAHWLPQTTSGNGSWNLVFHRYGSQRFLKVIAGSDERCAYLPETRMEREARVGRASATIVAATMQ